VKIIFELIQEVEEQVIRIRLQLKEAQYRYKSYVDDHSIEQSYKVEDMFFFHIRPNKKTIRF